MNRDLHPTAGARFLLERLPGDPAADGDAKATYRAVIYTPDAELATEATLRDDGSVALGATGAPTELHARLETICRLVARDAAKLRADGMPPWPSRILRWRK